MEVGEKIDILLLQGSLRHKHFLFMDKESSRGHQKDNVAFTEQVVQLLNRKRDIISEVWRNSVNEERLLVAPPPGNYEDKSTRVPRERVVDSFILYFII